MATLIGSQALELCTSLLHAEDETEVIAILEQAKYWDDRSAWVPYGNIRNNRGIVGNQQSSPVAAMVEKLVNSGDAVLTAECYRRGIDPEGPHAPKTMTEAVEQLLGVPGGRIQNLGGTSRTQLAHHVQLVATGRRDSPCYVIVDDGEGQCPDRFPETFLSLVRENKTRIPFVQGKYNMGGTGVLQFAGKYSFQLIISKRQPDIPANGNHSDQWGFTLVRRMEPAADEPQSIYVYLAPDGAIPSFAADSLDVYPGSYPEMYVAPMTAGTCIKLYNYKFPGRIKTIATLDLRYALEQFLQDPAVPIRVSERRGGYRAHYFDTTMSGLLSVLADNPEDIEPGLDTGSPLHVPGVGDVDVRLVVLKEGVSERFPSGVFFDVNGQLHGELDSGFIARNTHRDYVAKSMIVIVDCGTLPQRIREDLFLASRDRMRQIEERRALEQTIADYITEHPGIKELNSRRRQEDLASKLSDVETVSIIQDIVSADPTLAGLFGRGDRIKTSVGPIPVPVPYHGVAFPTYFRPTKEPRGGLVKKCPSNRTCVVEWETDAANDYFSRVKDRGRFTSKGLAIQSGGVHLHNGRALARFAVPPGARVGDRIQVEVEVDDVSRLEPFRSRFVMEVEAEAAPAPSGPRARPSGSGFAGLPNIREVRQDEWMRYDFTETSALLLRHGDENQLDIFVNMANLYLRNEVTKRRNQDPELVRYWFKYGLCLLALGMLHDQRQAAASVAERENGQATEVDDQARSESFDAIGHACRGLAVTVVPAIAQLSKARITRQVSAV